MRLCHWKWENKHVDWSLKVVRSRLSHFINSRSRCKLVSINTLNYGVHETPGGFFRENQTQITVTYLRFRYSMSGQFDNGKISFSYRPFDVVEPNTDGIFPFAHDWTISARQWHKTRVKDCFLSGTSGIIAVFDVLLSFCQRVFV